MRPVAKKDPNRERKDNVHSLGFQSVGLSIFSNRGRGRAGGLVSRVVRFSFGVRGREGKDYIGRDERIGRDGELGREEEWRRTNCASRGGSEAQTWEADV